MHHSIWLVVWYRFSIPWRSVCMFCCVRLPWINTMHQSGCSISYPACEIILLHPSERPNNQGVDWFFALCIWCCVLACLLLCWEPSSLSGPRLAYNTGCFLWPIGYVLCQHPRGGKYLRATGIAHCYHTGVAVEYTGNVVVWWGLYVCIVELFDDITKASKYPAYGCHYSSMTWCHSRGCCPNLWWVRTFALGI